MPVALAAPKARRKTDWVRIAKPFVFALSLTPLAYLGWAAYMDALGANPIERITRATGDWTLRFLLISLTVTPARSLLQRPELIRFRRVLGLFAFFYGTLHLMTYLWLDQFFDWASIAKDIGKRPFITAGFTAWLVMVPLAITSTAGWIRRLGGKNWRRLHRLVYVSAVIGVVHFWWLVKSDIREPALYGAILALLLGYRAVRAIAQRRSLSRRPVPVR